MYLVCISASGVVLTYHYLLLYLLFFNTRVKIYTPHARKKARRRFYLVYCKSKKKKIDRPPSYTSLSVGNPSTLQQASFLFILKGVITLSSETILVIKINV